MANESESSAGVCSECGQTEFTWGRLLDSEGRQAKFHPDGPFFSVLSTSEQIRVRKCDGCGQLQFFSEG